MILHLQGFSLILDSLARHPLRRFPASPILTMTTLQLPASQVIALFQQLNSLKYNCIWLTWLKHSIALCLHDYFALYLLATRTLISSSSASYTTAYNLVFPLLHLSSTLSSLIHSPPTFLPHGAAILPAIATPSLFLIHAFIYTRRQLHHRCHLSSTQ